MLLRTFTSAIFSAFAAAHPVLADDSYSDVIDLEVRPGWTQPDGTHIAALHLTLAPGWKTYWRAPGDAGIAPQFGWKGSRNIDNLSLIWPTPQVFDQNGLRSIGYKDQLVIPLQITPDSDGAGIRIKGNIDLGICKDICIPQTLSFDHLIDVISSEPDPVIAAAMASSPYSAGEAGVSSASCTLNPIDGGLRISATIHMPHSGGTEYAVIEAGDPQIWASQAETHRQGGQLTASSDLIHVNQSSFALDRSAVRITVLGQQHAVDIRGCAPG
ncbi:MAG: protein-disulfide reductase DsbD domain-containing protein [Paracoccaceae bacterium]